MRNLCVNLSFTLKKLNFVKSYIIKGLTLYDDAMKGRLFLLEHAHRGQFQIGCIVMAWRRE